MGKYIPSENRVLVQEIGKIYVKRVGSWRGFMEEMICGEIACQLLHLGQSCLRTGYLEQGDRPCSVSQRARVLCTAGDHGGPEFVANRSSPRMQLLHDRRVVLPSRCNDCEIPAFSYMYVGCKHVLDRKFDRNADTLQ